MSAKDSARRDSNPRRAKAEGHQPTTARGPRSSPRGDSPRSSGRAALTRSGAKDTPAPRPRRGGGRSRGGVSTWAGDGIEQRIAATDHRAPLPAGFMRPRGLYPARGHLVLGALDFDAWREAVHQNAAAMAAARTGSRKTRKTTRRAA